MEIESTPYEIDETLLQRMNRKPEQVIEAYRIFKSNYGNALKETTVSDIIHGSTITIKPDNILIDRDIKFNDEMFDKKAELCKLKLYKYQRDSIKKLREIELKGKHGDIVTNGCLLSLPIGSGKSLVFQFLALFYRDVPIHPIIVSTEGNSIPRYDQMQWKYYPYFYEKCCYEVGKVNAIQSLVNYQQRKVTVILTHTHLVDQMKEYFKENFDRRLIKATDIQYEMMVSRCDFSKADIVVVPANEKNVAELVNLSYTAPFMRVIIDDFTSMSGIDSFRQILSSSTIFVSGSGFDRKPEQVPASYYTLKTVPVAKISLVGNPRETFEGVFRNSIATMELVGTNCEFSQYEFVSNCEELCRREFKDIPQNIYPIIKKEPLINHYMTLMFLLKNADKIRLSLVKIERNLELGTLDKNKVKNYLEWKSNLGSFLYNHMYEVERYSNSDTTMIVKQSCMTCGSDSSDGYGAVACCCGAYYCYQCLKSMTTKKIYYGTTILESDDYYCCCCRKKNNKYYMNCTKMKDKSIWSFTLIEEFFDDYLVLKNQSKVDYYFYMFNHGLVPKYHEGKALNISNDIANGDIIIKDEKTIPFLENLLPRDQLAITSLRSINETLGRLKICPRPGTYILFYGTPQYMKNRVESIRKNIIDDNNEETLVSYGEGRNRKMIQPVEHLEIMFKDSVDSLIGLHRNILAIVAWKKAHAADEMRQIAGRIIRCNSWNNPLYFYISTNTIDFE